MLCVVKLILTKAVQTEKKGIQNVLIVGDLMWPTIEVVLSTRINISGNMSMSKIKFLMPSILKQASPLSCYHIIMSHREVSCLYRIKMSSFELEIDKRIYFCLFIMMYFYVFCPTHWSVSLKVGSHNPIFGSDFYSNSNKILM